MTRAEIAQRVRSLAHDIRSIRAYSNYRPHVFLEDKHELALLTVRLANEIDVGPELIVVHRPQIQAASGVIRSSRGTRVVVEVRRRRRAA